jgi:hypothetical protein
MGRSRLFSGWKQGSTNFGTTWAPSGAPVANWYSVASSADGTKLAAVIFGGGIYASTNSGTTWVLTSAPASNWASVASSADGLTLVAAVYGGPIYVSGARPKLSLTIAGTNVTLSWPTNAAGYALQQLTNVVTTNWTAVTNAPTVTNSQYNVMAPMSGVGHFYRLRSQCEATVPETVIQHGREAHAKAAQDAKKERSVASQ